MKCAPFTFQHWIITRDDLESSSRLSRKTGLSPILRGIKEKKMIVITIVILTLLFALGSIGPLLVTDDMQDIVMMEH